MAESDYRTTRIMTAEMRSASEYHSADPQIYPSFIYKPSISTLKEKTGTYSYDASLNEGFGDWNMDVFPVLTYRVGYWKLWGGEYNDFSILMVNGFDNKTKDLDIRYDVSKRIIRVDLRNPSTGILETVAYSHKLNSYCGSPMHWAHVGVVCNIYSGWISLWHNGIKMEHWEIVPPYPLSVFPAAAWYNGTLYLYVDDAYFDYSNNDEADLCPPNRRFYFASPNGAGDETQWTPVGALNNHECVDESTVPDDDTTYVVATTNGLLEMYEFTDVTIPADETPTAAAIQVYSRSTTGRESPPTLKLACKGTMNAAYGHTVRIYPRWILEKTWDVVFDRFDSLPQGGEWTVLEFNGGQFGFESCSII